MMPLWVTYNQTQITHMTASLLLTDEEYYSKPTLFQGCVYPTVYQTSQNASLGWQLMYA